MNKILTQEVIWENFEKTGILDGWDGKDIDINGEKIDENLVIINPDLDLPNTVDIDNWKKFSGKTLTFKNCPNLKSIEANCLNLTGIKFEGDCSQLEHLSAYNNELIELDLTNQKQLTYCNVDDNKLQSLQINGCESLDKLSCRNNELTSLNLDDNTKITYLNCANNLIWELAIENLDQLKTLSCNNNRLLELNPSGLKELRFLDCSNNKRVDISFTKINRLKEINLDGCESLVELDAGENGLEEIQLENLPWLWNVSFKNNELKKLTIRNCPRLNYLTLSYQNTIKHNVNIKEILEFFKVVTIEKVLDFYKLDTEKEAFDLLKEKNAKTFKFLEIDNIDKALNYFNWLILKTKNDFKFFLDEIIHTNFFIDQATRQSLKGMLYSKDISFYNIKNKPIDSGYPSENDELQPLTIDDFPNLDKEESGIDHLADNPLFELWRDRKIAEEENKELGNDSGYESAEEQKKKNNEPIITNPSQLTRNNYPDLLTGKFGRGPEITITGGRLAGTLIIDGYQGQKINVGNNRGLEYLVVRNCPHLTTLRYAHCGLKHDAWYDPKEFNNPNLTIIDNHNWDGGIAWGNSEDEENEKGYQEEFKEELAQETEDKKQEDLRAEFYKLLLEMLTQAEKYAEQGDWKQVEQKLAEVKAAVLKSHYHLSKEQLDEIMTRIVKLEKRLQSSQALQVQSVVKIVVGSIALTFLSLGILLLLTNKITKNFLTLSKLTKYKR
ncbi:MAG: hypothetical protein LBR43_02995 [Spiroplasmataceae bacterium]|nr:hypothetical protein [Spiroplasmataceae bacterium]